MTGDSFFDSVRAAGIVRPDDTPLVGVCAGMAQRWNVDSLLVRAAIVALTFLGGAGISLYAIGWLFLPDKTERIHAQEPFYGKVSSSFVVAVILALVPLFSFGAGPIRTGFFFGPFGFIISLIIIAVIAITLHSNQNKAAGNAPGPSPSAQAGSQSTQADSFGAEPHSPSNPSDGHLPGAASGRPRPGEPAAYPETQATTADAQEPHASTPATGPSGSNPMGPGQTGPSSNRPWLSDDTPAQDRSELYTTVSEDLDWKDPRPAASSRTVLLVIALLLIVAAGAAFLLDRGITPLTDTNLVLGTFAVAAIILGLTVAAHGITGRRGGGLSALAIIVAVASFPIAAVMSLPSADHHVLMGNKTWAPASAAEASGGYSMIMGNMDLDVTNLEEAEIDVSGRLGNVTIIVGDEQQVAVVADYVLSDVSGTDVRSDTSGVSGNATSLLGDIDTIDEADIVIYVDVIMSDLNIERQS